MVCLWLVPPNNVPKVNPDPCFKVTRQPRRVKPGSVPNAVAAARADYIVTRGRHFLQLEKSYFGLRTVKRCG
jgi:hypothetical protein